MVCRCVFRAAVQVTHVLGILVKGDLAFEMLVSPWNESQPTGHKGALAHLLTLAAKRTNGQSELPAGGQQKRAYGMLAQATRDSTVSISPGLCPPPKGLGEADRPGSH